MELDEMKVMVKKRLLGITLLVTPMVLSGCQVFTKIEKVVKQEAKQEKKKEIEENSDIEYDTVSFDVTLSNEEIMLLHSPNDYSTLYKVGSVKSPFELDEVVKVTEQAKTEDAIYYKLAESVWVNKEDVTLADNSMAKVQSLLDADYDDPDIGVFVKSLTTEKEAGIHADEVFTAASTGKLPIIYYTQKMISDKKIDPEKTFKNDTSKINEMDLSYQQEGAGVLQDKPEGASYSVDQVLRWTIEYSDNQGTNFLGYYVGNEYDKEMRDTVSGVIGRTWKTPFEVTAKENGRLMEEIHKLGGRAIEYMKNTEYDDERIAKYLPVDVAHKIGDVEGYEHDIAVVYAKEPYVLSVMTKNDMGYEKIAKLSKEIYDLLGP